MGYPSIDMIATGARIENLMRANNLSARQVADFMGFKAPQAVYKWLRGDSLPTLDNMCALSVLLHTNMESILVLMGGDVFFVLPQEIFDFLVEATQGHLMNRALCAKMNLVTSGCALGCSHALAGDDSQNPWLVKDKP